VSSLDAVENGLLVRVHIRILYVVLLPGLPDLEGEPHVYEEGPRRGQDDVAMFLGNKICVDHYFIYDAFCKD